MDETYIKIKGRRKYLYRAVDKKGRMIADGVKKLSAAGQFYLLAA